MLSQDLKLGLRALRRQPMVSLLAILTLGLGIGATTTIFTVVHTVLLEPLPYPEAEELMRETVSLEERVLGVDHRSTISSCGGGIRPS